MANFFSTAVGKALTGVVSKVAGGYSPIAGALVEGAAAYAEGASLEKKAKAQAKKFAASLPKGISLSVSDQKTVVARNTLKQAKDRGFVGSGMSHALVPPNPPRALTLKRAPTSAFTSATAALASLVPKPQVSKPGQIGLPDLWDALSIFRPKSAVQYPAKKVTTRYEVGYPEERAMYNGNRIGGATGTWQGPTMEQAGFRIGRRRRSINHANIRALRRAARRMEGFCKIAKRFLVLKSKMKFKPKKRTC